MEKEKEKQTVLIVDDEAVIRLFVRVILEDAGHEVKEASNADDALRLIADDGITVVVTDIDMPGSMDGLALARGVAARWPDIGLVVTSVAACRVPMRCRRRRAFYQSPSRKNGWLMSWTMLDPTDQCRRWLLSIKFCSKVHDHFWCAGLPTKGASAGPNPL
jgi:CheY-like chemotaxis protein